MWKPSEYFTLQSSIEQISTKFKELESQYYSHLRKAHKENERMMKQDHNLGSDFFHNLLREQNKLEDNIRSINVVREQFGDEIQKISNIIFDNVKTVPTEEQPESIVNVKSLVENNMLTLREKIVTLEDAESFSSVVSRKITGYFEDSYNELQRIFSHFSQYQDNNVNTIVHKIQNSKKIEELCRFSDNAMNGCDAAVEAIKKKLINSFSEIEGISVAFSKESQSLKVSLDYLKSQLHDVQRETSLPGSAVAEKSVNRLSSPPKTYGKSSNHSQLRIKKSLTSMDSLASDCLNHNLRMNKFFSSVKEEFETVRTRIKQQIKELSNYSEQVRSNSNSIIMHIKEDKSARDVTSFENSRNQSVERFDNKATKSAQGFNKQGMLIDKLSPYRTFQGSPSKESQPMYTRDSRSQSPQQRFNDLKGSQIRESAVKFEKKVSELEANLRQSNIELDDLRRDSDIMIQSLNQKLSYIKTSARNFIISSGKIASALRAVNPGQEFNIQVYENDKKILENYLNQLNDFTQKYRMGSSPTKGTDAGRIRSQSQENFSKKNSSAKKKQSATANNFFLEDVAHEDPENNKIRNLIDEFEKKHSDVLQMLEKDKSSSKINGPSSFNPNLRQEISPEGNKLKQSGNFDPETIYGLRSDLKSLRNELASLKVKYEKLNGERNRLKEENASLTYKLKSRGPTSSNLLEKFKEVSESHENVLKENSRLNKLAKKLEKKAEDRKKNLKQLFDLLEEKEKELQHYKKNVGSNANLISDDQGTVLSSAVERMESLINQKQRELEQNYVQLQEQLKSKERELLKMSQMVSNISARTGRTGRDHDNILIKTDDDSLPNTMRRADKADEMMELERRKIKLEELINNMQAISPSKSRDANELLNFLKREKDLVVQKLQNQEQRSSSSKKQSRFRSPADEGDDLEYRIELNNVIAERDELKDSNNQLEVAIEQMRIENQNLQESYDDLMQDMNTAAEHRKRMEKNFNENIALQNKKIEELNDYISELESRHSKHSKGGSESAHKDQLGKLKEELETVSNKLTELYKYLNVSDDEYSSFDAYQKAHNLLYYLKQRDLDRQDTFGNESNNRYSSPDNFKNSTFGNKAGMSSPNYLSSSQFEIVKQQNSEYETLLDSYKKQVLKLQQQKDDAEKDASTKESEIRRTKSEYDSKLANLEEKNRSFKNLENQRNKLQVEYESIVAKISSIALKHDMLSDDQEISHQEILDKIDSHMRELMGMKNELKTRSDESDINRTKENAYKEKIQEIEGLNRALYKNNEELKKDLKLKTQEYETLNERFNKLSQSGESNSSQLNNQIIKLSNENSQLREEINELEKKHEGATYDHEEALAQLNNKHKSEIKQKLAEKDTQIAELKRDHMKAINDLNTKMWTDNEQLNQKIDDLKGELNKANSEKKGIQSAEKNVRNRINQLEDDKTQLQTEKDQLAKDKKAAEDAKRGLENEKKGLEGEIQQLNQKLQELKSQVSDLESKLQNTEEAQKKAETELHHKQNECTSLQNEISSMKKNANASISDIEKRNNELNQKYSEAMTNLKDKEQELKNAKTNIDQLSTARNDVQSKLNDTQNELDGLKSQNQKYQIQVEGLLGDIKQLQADIKQMNSEKREAEATIKSLNVNINDLTNQLDDVKFKYDTLESTNKDQQTEIERLNTQIKSIKSDGQKSHNDLMTVVDSLNEKQKALGDQLSEAKIKNDNLEKEIEKLKQEKKRSEQASKDKQSEIEELQRHLDDANGMIEQYKKSYEDADAKLVEIQQQNKNLEDSQYETQQQMEVTIQNQNEKIEYLEADIKKLNGQLEAKNHEIDGLKSQVIKWQDQNRKVDEKLKNKEQQASQEIGNLETKINELAHDIEEKDRKIGQLQMELGEAQTGNQNSSEKLTKLRNELEDAQKTISELQGEKQAIATEKKLMRQESAGTIAEITQKISEYETQVSDLTSKNKNLQTQIQDLQSEVQSLKGQIDTRDKQLHQYDADFKAQEDASTQKINQAKEELRALEQQVREKDGQIEQASHEKADLESRINDLGKQKKAVESSKKEIEDQLVSTKQELSDEINNLKNDFHEKEKKLKEKIGDLKDRNKEYEKERLDQINQIVNINTELQTVNNKYQNLLNNQQSDKGELNQKIAQLTRERDQLNNKVADLTEKVQDFDKEKLHIQAKNLNEIDDLKEKIEELTTGKSDLKTLIKELEMDKTIMENEKKSYQRKNDEMRLQLQEYEEQFEMGKRMLEEQEAELEDLRQQLKNGGGGAANAEDPRMIETYKNEIRQKDKEIDTVHGEMEMLQSAKERLDEEHQELQNNFDRMLQDYNTMKVNYQELVRDRHQMKQHLDASERDLQNMNQKHQNSDEVSHRNQIMHAEIHEWEEKYNHVVGDLDDLRQVRDQLQDQLQILVRDNEDLHKQNENLSNQKKDLENKNLHLQDRVNGALKQDEQRKQEIERLKVDNANLERMVVTSPANKGSSKQQQEFKNSFEVMRNENNNLRMELEELKEDNGELRTQNKMLQEQLVLINSSADTATDRIKKILLREFRNMASTRALKGIEIKVDKDKDVEQIMKRIRESVLENDREVENLRDSRNSRQFSQPEENVDQRIKEIQQETMAKMADISRELEKILVGLFKGKPGIRADVAQRKDLTKLDMLIFSNIGQIADYASNLIEKTATPQQGGGDMEKMIKQLEDQNESLMEELRRSQQKDNEKFGKEISFNEPVDLDDKKVQSFLENSMKVDRKSEKSDSGINEEFIQNLRNENRQLEDEKEKLLEQAQLYKTDAEMQSLKNEDLVREITDLEEKIRRLTNQIEALRRERQDVESSKTEAVSHIKEHLRQMFRQFMTSALEGKKESQEHLRLFLSILDMSETDKAAEMEKFKKSTTKKSLFKIF